MRAPQLTAFTAGCRMAIGGAFLAAPQLAMRPWIGSEASRPAARLLARVVGVRDLVLAAGTLTAPDDEIRRRWLLGALAADAADLALTLAARDQLPRRGGLFVCAVAAGGVALGAAALSDRRPRPPR